MQTGQTLNNSLFLVVPIQQPLTNILSLCICSAPQTFTDGSELRKRVVREVGATALLSEPDDPVVPREAPPKPARSPPKTPTEEVTHVAANGTWSPLLTSVFMCTVLAAGAYACYRTYFHWCLLFPICLFLYPSLCWLLAGKEKERHRDTHTFSAGPVSLSWARLTLSECQWERVSETFLRQTAVASLYTHTHTHTHTLFAI